MRFRGNGIGPKVSPGSAANAFSWSAYWKTQMKFSEGTVLDDMNALTGWAKGGTGSAMELNETQKYSGTGSIKLTTGSGVQGRMSKTIVRDFTSDNGISFCLKAYAHTNPATTISAITIMASETSSLANYFTRAFGPSVLTQDEWVNLDVRKLSTLSVDNGYNGWTVGSGSPNWANITYLRIAINPVAGQVAVVSFDLIEHGATYKPTVMIAFDDRNISDYTRAFPYLRSKKMVATSYIVSESVGANYMTDSHLQTLNACKWDIANHTTDHSDLSLLATEAEIIAKFNGCETYLNNLGLTRASKHAAYPMSNTNATVYAAIAAWGGLTGRGSGNGYSGNMTYAYNYPYSIATLSGTVVDTVKTQLDHVNTYKTSLTILFHSLADDTDYANFCEIIDYIETLGIQTLTISEFYRLATEDVTVHHK